MRKSDIPELLKRVETFLVAVEIARGGAKHVVKAAPLEIDLYNITTSTKRVLEQYRAGLQDALGIYMENSK